MTGVSDAQAALERGRALMLVTPPAVEQADMVWELLQTPTPGPSVLILCADSAAAEEWADAAPAALALRTHAVTGLGRTVRLLQDGTIAVLAGSPEDLHALSTRSALKLDAVRTVVIAWPEWLIASGRLPVLEQLLGETRDARRIVLAWNPQVLEDFLERYARRPHVVGDLPMGEDARPLAPVGPARYVLLPRARRAAARREVLDALDRPRVLEWRRGTALDAPADVVVCFDLPTREELVRLAATAEPVLLLAPAQLPYARSIATPLTPLPLLATRLRAQSEADALRARTAARIEAGALEAELGFLEPLLGRYDAAEVAAALLSISRQHEAAAEQPTSNLPHPTPSESWVRLFVNVGKKDRAAAKDLVGAMTREIGLAREDIGRIEVREGFTLVSVAAHAVDTAIRGLSRVAIRGRRLSARRDRET